MKIEIRHRSTKDVLFTAEEAADMGDALRQALKAGADLTGADLTGADLTGADLTGADLTGASLRDADLSRANLTGADLSCADLTDADLSRANLRGANLTGSKLFWTDLTNVLLTPEQLAQIGLEIPRVADLDHKVLAAVTSEGGTLDMGTWHASERTAHACGSTHCRAGWAIHLAGPEGYALEDKVGPGVAGALIYLSSTQRPVPHFGARTKEALADIQRCAEDAPRS